MKYGACWGFPGHNFPLNQSNESGFFWGANCDLSRFDVNGDGVLSWTEAGLAVFLCGERWRWLEHATLRSRFEVDRLNRTKTERQDLHIYRCDVWYCWMIINDTSIHPKEASIPIPCQVLPLVNTLYESFGLQPRCRRSFVRSVLIVVPKKMDKWWEVMRSDEKWWEVIPLSIYLYLDGTSWYVIGMFDVLQKAHMEVS